MAKNKVPDDVRSRGVALLMAGGSIGGVAKELGLSKGTVQRWYNSLRKDLDDGRMHTAEYSIQVQNSDIQPDRMHTMHTQKKTRATLLDELVDKQLEALVAQLDHFKNPEWLERQSAEGLAMLYGIEMDKAIRMLELIAKAKALRNKSGQAALPLESDA